MVWKGEDGVAEKGDRFVVGIADEALGVDGAICRCSFVEKNIFVMEVAVKEDVLWGGFDEFFGDFGWIFVEIGE